MFTQPSASALNHLLTQNNWALPRLARFAGKTARFDIAPFYFAYSIQADGSLRGADNTATADVVCTIPMSLLPRLALHDEKAYADICTDGDPALLSEIFFLARNLRWDVTKDLSRITGDNAAELIVGTLHEQRQNLHGATQTLARMVSDYLTEEHALLAKTQQVTQFMEQIDKLRDDVARLEQRIDQLNIDQLHSARCS